MLQYLQQLVDSPQMLKQGDQLLLARLANPSSRQQTLHIIANKTFKYAPVLVQNVYKTLWQRTNQQTVISEQEKQITRTVLINTLLNSTDNLSYMESLVVMISKLHSLSGEGYTHWDYKKLLEFSEQGHFEYVLEVLLFLYRESDSSIRTLTAEVMPYLLAKLESLIADKTYPPTSPIFEKIYILNFGLVKSFSVFEGVDDGVVDRCFDSTAEGWFSRYLTVLSEGSQAQQKLILKILTILYGDLPQYTKPTLNRLLPVIWIYFNKLVPVYLVDNVYNNSDHAEKINNKLEEKYLNQIEFEPNTSSEGLVFQALELMEALFARQDFRTLNTFAYYPLMSVYYNLLEAQRVQEKEWCEDPNKFLADIEDENSHSIRNRILSQLQILFQNDINDSDGVSVAEILQIIIVGAFEEVDQQTLKSKFEACMLEKGVHKFISDSKRVFGLTLEQLATIYSSAFHTVSEQHWKRKEVALLLLFNFGEELLPALTSKSSVFPILQAQLKEYSQHPVLAMQALHTASRCLETLKEQELFTLFVYLREALKGVLGLRLVAVKLLGGICRHLKQKGAASMVLNQQIVTEVVQLVQNFDKDTAHIFLQSCVEMSRLNKQTCHNLANKLQSVAPRLIQQLYQDGLQYSVMVDLFSICYSPNLQNWVISTIQAKHADKTVSELCGLCFRLLEAYMKDGLDPSLFSPARLSLLIKKLTVNQQAEAVVREFIKVYDIDNQLLALLSKNMRKSWVVPLQKRGHQSAFNMEEILLRTVTKILDVSSQYQLQNELALLLYFFYHEAKQVVTILKYNNLYRPLLEKWLKYQYVFIGTCLRKCTCYILNQILEEDLMPTYLKYVRQKKESLQNEDAAWDPEWEDDEAQVDLAVEISFLFINLWCVCFRISWTQGWSIKAWRNSCKSTCRACAASLSFCRLCEPLLHIIIFVYICLSLFIFQNYFLLHRHSLSLLEFVKHPTKRKPMEIEHQHKLDCSHINSPAHYAKSVQGKSVFKDQCSKCFAEPKSSGGIYLCLLCFNSFCPDRHLEQHSQKHPEHVLFVGIQMHELPPPETGHQITKVAVGKEGGAYGGPQYQTKYSFACTKCKTNTAVNVPEIAVNKPLAGLIQSLIQCDSAYKKQSLVSWELQIQPCEHTLTLQQEPTNFDLTKCGECELSSNLWLCLTCGHTGCARKNYDGSGGNSHGIEHYNKTGHPLVVKSGTITPEGDASIHCYKCDEQVRDNFLVDHLALLGINILQQKKTEKTIQELTLDMNLALSLSRLVEEGKKITPMYGAGYTGMDNIGNSCYLNSSIQLLLSLDQFKLQYYHDGVKHLQTCNKIPNDCFLCQLAKLAEGLYSGRYSEKRERKILINDEWRTEEYQEAIRPYDFKMLIAAKHQEFSSSRQQDALEYLQYLFDRLNKEEKSLKLNNTPVLFDFKTANKLICVDCGSYKVVPGSTNEFKFPVPDPTKEQLEAFEASLEGQKNEEIKKSKKNEEPQYPTTFKTCLDMHYQGDSVELHCPKCNKKSVFRSLHLLTSTPKYLLAVPNRFRLVNWVPKKLNALIQMDEQWDISPLLLENNHDGVEQIKEGQGEEPKQYTQEAVNMITDMGFSRNAAIRALIATKNDIEAACGWIYQHIDDANINDPVQSKSKTSNKKEPPADLIEQVKIMGFSDIQAKAALVKFNNNVEMAIGHLFDCGGEVGDLLHLLEEKPAQGMELEAGPKFTKYQLIGAIVHLGRSVHSGHYVVYVKKEGQWVLMNDSKVSLAPEPVLEKGYIYLYRAVA